MGFLDKFKRPKHDLEGDPSLTTPEMKPAPQESSKSAEVGMEEAQKDTGYAEADDAIADIKAGQQFMVKPSQEKNPHFWLALAKRLDEKLGYVICPYCIKRYDATWKPPENTSDKSSLRE